MKYECYITVPYSNHRTLGWLIDIKAIDTGRPDEPPHCYGVYINDNGFVGITDINNIVITETLDEEVY